MPFGLPNMGRLDALALRHTVFGHRARDSPFSTLTVLMIIIVDNSCIYMLISSE